MKPSVRRPPVGNGQRHTASSALRRGVSCRCLRQTLPSGRVLPKNTEPAAGKAADLLFPDRLSKRDDFYSELCSKRSRGLARVWTLEREGNIICTVGAYALANGQAYMACGETVEALRGKGVGGRLIVEMANALAAEGWMPVFLCSPERVHFYTRLGFEKMGEYARYEVQ